MAKRIGANQLNACLKALLIGVFSACFLILLAGNHASAATGINKQINFQGKVTNPNGTNVANNTYTFVFKLYTASSGGVAVWTETDSLLVTDGVFQVNLGAVTALPGSVDFNTDNIYLGITFNSDPAGEMAPRVQFTATPYAFNSDLLDGLDSSAFDQLAANQTITGTKTFQPTTNITSAIVKQTSVGSPTADIFNVQTANSTNVLQVTGPAANEAAVTLQSVGATRALTLTSQAAATWSTAAGTLTLQGGGGTAVTSAGQTTSNSGSVALSTGATTVNASHNSGDITLTTGNATGATSNSGSVTIDVGSATGTRGSITLGTGSNTPSAITIGTTSVPTTTIAGTTMNLGTIGSATPATTVHLADTTDGTNTQAVTIGSNAKSTNFTTVQGQTISLGTIGAATTPTAVHIADTTDGTSTQAVTIGSNAKTTNTTTVQGQTINAGTVGTATTATTVHIADTTDATNTQAVTIGSNAKSTNTLALQGQTVNVATVGAATTASTVHIADTSDNTGTQAVTIGSVAKGANATNIQGGTTGGINIGSIGATTTGSTLHIADTSNGTGTQAVTIGSNANAANVVTLQGQTINLGAIGSATTGTAIHLADTSNATGTQSISLGSVANAANGTTIQGGTTGGINIGSIGSATTGSTIHIADTNNATGTQVVTIGSSAANASNAVTINSGAVVETHTNTGVTIKTNTNSSSALQVQNSLGANLIAVDTAGSSANNLITTITANGTPSFENNSITGWTGQGGCTLSAVTSLTSSPAGNAPFNGNYSGQCSNTATAGAEFRYVTAALTTNAVYTFNFYAKVSATPGAFLSFGHRENGGAEDVAGLSLTTQAINNNGWTRYSLTFRTGGTLAAGDYLYIKQSDATLRTLWIDGVTLQTDANADTSYSEGNLGVGGVINTSLVLQNASNSTTALQVQNSAGTSVFNVDTSDTNLITNPGFEVNGTGWTAVGTGATVIRDTSTSYNGSASLKILTGSTANSGAQFALNPIVTTTGTTYTVSFSSLLKAGDPAFTDLIVRFSPNGAATADCTVTAMNTATVVSTGWTRHTCSFSSATAPTTSGFILIKDTAAATHNFWIDSVQLEQSATASAYGAGSVSINGVIESPTVFKNTANSDSAFSVQNAASTQLFVIDSANSRIYIGSQTADANATLLVLDTKNTTGDPAVVNGAMYYNSFSNNSRCAQNNVWFDCVNEFNTLTKAADQPATVSSTVMNNDNTLVFPVLANTTYSFDAWILVDNTNTTADSQYTFTTPAGATLSIDTDYTTAAGATAPTSCIIFVSGTACVQNGTVNIANMLLRVSGMVANGANAGNVQFQFTQRVSNVNAFPVIKKGSTLTWHQGN